jgi:hypothetical protein
LDRDSSACGAGRVKDEEVPHGAIRIACSLLVVVKLPGNMLRPCAGVRVCGDVLQRSTAINRLHLRRIGLPGNSTVGLLLGSFRQQNVRAATGRTPASCPRGLTASGSEAATLSTRRHVAGSYGTLRDPLSTQSMCPQVFQPREHDGQRDDADGLWPRLHGRGLAGHDHEVSTRRC